MFFLWCASVVAEDLFALFQDAEDNQETIEQMILGIFTIRKEGSEQTDDQEEVGIIIEGVEVLHDLGHIAAALKIWFGLMY